MEFSSVTAVPALEASFDLSPGKSPTYDQDSPTATPSSSASFMDLYTPDMSSPPIMPELYKKVASKVDATDNLAIKIVQASLPKKRRQSLLKRLSSHRLSSKVSKTPEDITSEVNGLSEVPKRKSLIKKLSNRLLKGKKQAVAEVSQEMQDSWLGSTASSLGKDEDPLEAEVQVQAPVEEDTTDESDMTEAVIEIEQPDEADENEEEHKLFDSGNFDYFVSAEEQNKPVESEHFEDSTPVQEPVQEPQDTGSLQTRETEVEDMSGEEPVHEPQDIQTLQTQETEAEVMSDEEDTAGVNKIIDVVEEEEAPLETKNTEQVATKTVRFAPKETSRSLDVDAIEKSIAPVFAYKMETTAVCLFTLFAALMAHHVAGM